MNVTLSSKCYVTVCVGCDDLFQSSRRDQMTCSGACRTRACRNGALAARKAAAAVTKAAPATIGWAVALGRLRPDLVPVVMAGEAEFEDLMSELNRAFVYRLYQAIAQADAEASQ